MATISKNWAAQAQIEGSGDGYTTLSGTTEAFSDDVDLETNGYEGAHVIVEFDYDADAEGPVVIALYGSLDGTNYDDTPIWSMQGDESVDPQQLSFVVRDLAHFRLGFTQIESADTNKVRAYQKSWNYSSV